ncbi:MAG: ATP-binding domain-containing protein [Dysgonamonadaceae bacterium]|jgi:superfamily I DNA and RNA helicase|nr:ATP-binding domain-containing protein [Dysgonamonadaceae bacterium]
MALEIVRGNITKIQPTKNLILSLTKIINEISDNGTLYLGYPLSANSESKITIDALLVTEKKGLVSFIFPESFSDIAKIKEEQDTMYYQLDFNFKKYNNLRKGRGLSFKPSVVTMFPSNDIPQIEDEYLMASYEKLKGIFDSSLDEFDKSIYPVLCEVLQRVSNIKPRKKRDNVENEMSMGGIIKKIEKEIANLDQWQKKAALEIPEGPQRIRGLAGSGKTIVLALKAAYLHSQNPDWKIAVTFYTRALSQQYYDLIRQFSFEFSGEEPNWDNLHIIHAWGSYQEKGVYSIAASLLNETPYTYTSAVNQFGRNDAFEGICNKLLPLFDSKFASPYEVLLIDEAQDMPISFFKVAYELVKNPKRITWAYDELQNLNETAMPSLEEMFGVDENGDLKVNLETGEDEAQRDIVLPVCYRNPPWTLAMAHALGFGIYRETGKIQMFDELKLWGEIGYKLDRGKLSYGSNVILSRKTESTPKYFNELLSPDTSIYSKVFSSTDDQYKWISEQIEKNINEDELDPDDILVIFPDAIRSKRQYTDFRRFLLHKGIESVLVGVNTDKETFRLLDHVSCSGIYRAKGNESPMVYIVNAEHCAEGIELIKLRNTLFTAITRSRGWVRICGVGPGMDSLETEIRSCINKEYALDFKLPTKKELTNMRRINRERSEEEVEKFTKAQKSLQTIIAGFESGELDPELFPEVRELLKIINNTQKSVDDDPEEF